MFALNEKVVYIGNVQIHPIELKLGVKIPIPNEIYTIREFETDEENNVGIRLKEITNPILKYKDGTTEKAYHIRHFRKLDHDFSENLLSEITRQVKEEEKLLRLDREQEAQKHFSIVLKEIWKW
jgi:hypothetical protein